MEKARQDYFAQGYCTYKANLSPEECELLSDKAKDNLRDLIFRNYPKEERPDLKLQENHKLLTNKKAREEAGYNSRDIWRNGVSQTPHWSKNSGMFGVYYEKTAQRLLHFHPTTIQKIANLYGHSELSYTRGLDRVSCKLEGSTKMPTHLDCHLFNDELNPDPIRAHAFQCVSVDSKIKPEHSGNIQLIPYFQLYWDIARRYFAKGGDHELSTEEYRDIPHQPIGKQLNKELPGFNVFLENLHEVRDKKRKHTKETLKYKDLMDTLPEKFHELRWKAIRLEAGDLFCWNQKIPHGSLPNKSKIPRIVYYITLLPRPSTSRGYPENWEGSDIQKKLIKNNGKGMPGQHQGGNGGNDLERKFLHPVDYQYWYVPEKVPEGVDMTLDEYRDYCDYLQGK